MNDRIVTNCKHKNISCIFGSLKFGETMTRCIGKGCANMKKTKTKQNKIDDWSTIRCKLRQAKFTRTRRMTNDGCVADYSQEMQANV